MPSGHGCPHRNACFFFSLDFEDLTEVFAPGRPSGYTCGRPRGIRLQNLLFGLLFHFFVPDYDPGASEGWETWIKGSLGSLVYLPGPLPLCGAFSGLVLRGKSQKRRERITWRERERENRENKRKTTENNMDNRENRENKGREGAGEGRRGIYIYIYLYNTYAQSSMSWKG